MIIPLKMRLQVRVLNVRRRKQQKLGFFLETQAAKAQNVVQLQNQDVSTGMLFTGNTILSWQHIKMPWQSGRFSCTIMSDTRKCADSLSTFPKGIKKSACPEQYIAGFHSSCFLENREKYHLVIFLSFPVQINFTNMIHLTQTGNQDYVTKHAIISKCFRQPSS